MKKLLIRILMAAALLFVLNWIYTKTLYKKDVAEHADVLELVWDVESDTCRVVYLGASSNNTSGEYESSRRKISEYVGEYYPHLKIGDMTKEASHALIYYYMLKRLSKKASVETVVVSMNLRSFDARWIYSDLETPLREQLVLMEDYPPFMNRFLLALKVYPYPIENKAVWDSLTVEHWRHDSLVFPYEFEWNNVYDWDSATAWRGLPNYEGQYDPAWTQLACHYIKSYGFQIRDDNPRLKDFDHIVALCRKRGWNLVFNLEAENVDKASGMVGKDLMYLIKYNHDYLVNRYGHLEGVTLVDNLHLVRDVNFIDQDWTTEHYYEEGRRIIARNVAQALRAFYPDDYLDPYNWYYDVGHYYYGDDVVVLSEAQPYGPTLDVSSQELGEDWERVNVSFMMQQPDTLDAPVLAVQWYDDLENSAAYYYPLHDQISKVGQWDFATFDLPVADYLRSAKHFKIFVYNPSETPIQVKGMDISFRPAYLKPGVKAKSARE